MLRDGRGLGKRCAEKKLAGRKMPRLHLRPRSHMPGITGTFKAVKRVLKAATAINPGEYRAAGLPVSCPHCRGNAFNESPNLGGGVNLACRKCHYVLWFAKSPQAV